MSVSTRTRPSGVGEGRLHRALRSRTPLVTRGRRLAPKVRYGVQRRKVSAPPLGVKRRGRGVDLHPPVVALTGGSGSTPRPRRFTPSGGAGAFPPLYAIPDLRRRRRPRVTRGVLLLGRDEDVLLPAGRPGPRAHARRQGARRGRCRALHGRPRHDAPPRPLRGDGRHHAHRERAHARDPAGGRHPARRLPPPQPLRRRAALSPHPLPARAADRRRARAHVRLQPLGLDPSAAWPACR